MTASEDHSNSEQRGSGDGDQVTEEQSFLPTAEDDLSRDYEGSKKYAVRKESTEVNYRQLGLCQRLSVDHPFRRRFIHTLWLFWSFVGLGWMVGQTGPALPDLQLIVKQDLDTASWLFTIFSIGYLLGSFFGGILYDRFNKLLLILFSVLIMAITTGILPWCENFYLMLAVRFISGIGTGGLDTGGNADLVGLWDDEGRPFMQALHFCFGFGGIISPLITEPFLAEKTCVFDTDSSHPANIWYNSSSNTMTTVPVNTTVPMVTEMDVANTTTPCREVYEQTRIHYAYAISFFFILSTGIPFLFMYFKLKCRKKTHDMAACKDHIDRPDKLPKKLKVMFLLLLFALMFLYCAVEDTFSGFLATFCINHFKWQKSTSSFATSTHWASFSLGRFSGIFLIMRFKPVQLIGVFCLSFVTAFIGLAITSVTMSENLVWIFIAQAGFSMSVVFGCIFTWTEESILKVSGKISSMFLIAASCGLMVNPVLLGSLMDNYSPLWFVYLLLIESCSCFILFIVIYLLVKKLVKFPPKPADIEIEVAAPEEMKQMDTSMHKKL